MDDVPQRRMKVEDKAAWLPAMCMCRKKRSGSAPLRYGRIFLRESEKEPVIRVMVEAQTMSCVKAMDEMVQVIQEEGLAVE